MKDKKIIINGKECRYWFRPNPDDYRKCSLRGKDDNCDEINDCFIKELLGKLALKEQECDELKQEKAEIQKYLGISHKTILERLEELTDFRDRDGEELDQLKQALIKIKKIAEENCKLCLSIDGFNKPYDCGLCEYAKILQKTSEVEECKTTI